MEKIPFHKEKTSKTKPPNNHDERNFLHFPRGGAIILCTNPPPPPPECQFPPAMCVSVRWWRAVEGGGGWYEEGK